MLALSCSGRNASLATDQHRSTRMAHRRMPQPRWATLVLCCIRIHPCCSVARIALPDALDHLPPRPLPPTLPALSPGSLFPLPLYAPLRFFFSSSPLLPPRALPCLFPLP